MEDGNNYCTITIKETIIILIVIYILELVSAVVKSVICPSIVLRRKESIIIIIIRWKIIDQIVERDKDMKDNGEVVIKSRRKIP